MEDRNPSLGKLIHRLDVGIGRRLRAEESSKICPEASGANGHIIRFLLSRDGETVCQRDLETEFGITRSTASRVLNLMEQKGLIERRAVTGDARLKQVILTEKARQVHREMDADFQAMEGRLLKGFSPEEVETLLGYIRRMEENLCE